MLQLLGWLVGVVVIWFLGAAALALAGIRHGDVFRAVPGDLAAGVVLLTVSSVVLIAAGARVSLAVTYGLLTVLLIASWSFRRRPVFDADLPADKVARWLLVLGGVLFALIIASATTGWITWDAIAVWAFKAVVLSVEGTLPPAFMSTYEEPYLSYPLALPLLTWWLAEHSRLPIEVASSSAGAIWYGALALLMWSSLRRPAGERVAALAAVGICAYWYLAYVAVVGTADSVIALALLGFVVELEDAIRRDETAAFWRAALFLALGLAAKREGLPLFVVGGSIGAAVVLWMRPRRPMRLLPWLLPVLVAAPWLTFVAQYRPQPAPTAAEQIATARSLGLQTAPEYRRILGIAPARVLAITKSLSRFAVQSTELPAILLGVGGIVIAILRRERALLFLWLFLAAYLAAIIAAWLTFPYEIWWMLATTRDRVAGALIPAVVFLGVLSMTRLPGIAVQRSEDEGSAYDPALRVPPDVGRHAQPADRRA